MELVLDILRGTRLGLQGRRKVKPPPGWDAVKRRLGQSPMRSVRFAQTALSVTFGGPAALKLLREKLADRKVDTATRESALLALRSVKDKSLEPILYALLDDPALQGAALRALADFYHKKTRKKTAKKILAVYPKLPASRKRDALTTLSSRAYWAHELKSAYGQM